MFNLTGTEKIQEEKEMKTESGEKAELDAVDPRPELSGEWTRPKSYICSPCGQSFSDFLILLEHQRCSHSNVWCTHIQLDASMQCVTGELSEQIVRSVSRSTPSSASAPFRCTQCLLWNCSKTPLKLKLLWNCSNSALILL